MKKVFTILLILYSLTSKSQDTVYVFHTFTLDKEIKYEIVKGRFDSQKPEFANVESLTKLTSLSRTKNKVLTETTFTYGETIVKDFDMNIIPEAQRKQMNIYKDAEIKLITDPFGFYYGLSNFKKLHSFIKKSYINIIKLSKPDATNAEIDKVTKLLAPTIANEDILMMTYFPEITLLMSLNGTLLIKGEKLSEPIELPNPFGGNSFAATNITTIDEIKNGNVIISSNTIVDEQSLNEGMKQMLKSMDTSDEEIKEMPTFNMTNEINYIYYLKENKILEINTEKKITLPNRNRIDKLSIKEI